MYELRKIIFLISFNIIINIDNILFKTLKNNTNLVSIEKLKFAWEEFINNIKYKKYFVSNDDAWLLNLENVKIFMDKYNKRPSQLDKNKENRYLGHWLVTQSTNYDNKEDIMKNDNIRKIWEDLKKSNYKEYMMNFEELWYLNLDKVKQFIKINKKKPALTDNDDGQKLANWISTQKRNYKFKINIMSNNDIIKSWEEFINDTKYNKYFIKKKSEEIEV